MKFSGLCNLNRKGSPGCNTRNVLDPLGCQKLASSGASRVRCSYQFLSVTPTQIFIGHCVPMRLMYAEVHSILSATAAASSFDHTRRNAAKPAWYRPCHALRRSNDETASNV